MRVKPPMNITLRTCPYKYQSDTETSFFPAGLPSHEQRKWKHGYQIKGTKKVKLHCAKNEKEEIKLGERRPVSEQSYWSMTQKLITGLNHRQGGALRDHVRRGNKALVACNEISNLRVHR